MSEVAGTGVVEQDDPSFASFLDDQAEQFGSADDTEDVLGELEGLLDGDEAEGEGPEVEEEGSGVGTTDVLRRLDTEWPAGAKAVRSMQQQMGRNQNEFNQLKGQMLDLVMELQGMKGAQEEFKQDVPEEELPEGVTQEHLDRFAAIAKRLGFERREERQEVEVSRAADESAEADLQRGVELYGDAFGSVDETGQVVLNPQVQERLVRRLNALTDPKRGITPLDLFTLEFGGRRQGGGKPARKPPSPKANVARRSTGGGRRSRIYEPARNDSADDVFARAWALAKQELSS